MFLDRMNENEKRSFLALANAFIRCDDELSTEETELVRCLTKEAGLSEAGLPAATDIATLSDAFSDRSSKICALLELIGLGHADSDYSAAESQFIGQLAAKWEIGETEVELLENWVLRLLSLMTEVQTMIDGKE